MPTFDGRAPWVPVTTDEYLAFEERRLARAVAETDRGIAKMKARVGQYDESGPRQLYEAMKNTDPAEAEKFWNVNDSVKQLDDLRALRASLSPSQLQAQAREGYISTSPARPVDTLPRLVRWTRRSRGTGPIPTASG